jgi:extradiol dioxygenase family protein
MPPAERYIFHLAFPVADLSASKDFYCRVLGAGIGRENPEWLDVLLWGHQITLHRRPDDVLPDDRRGKRHFGVVLPWSEWQALADRLRREGVAFFEEPHVLLAGTPEEQAKLYLEDPSHNVIEIKAYRDLDATLRLQGTAYRYDRS